MEKKNVHLQVMVTQSVNNYLNRRAARQGMSVPEAVRAIIATHMLREACDDAGIEYE